LHNKKRGSRTRPFVVKVRPMPRDFFDPTPEQQNVVLIDAATPQKAQRMNAGCEACSETAQMPFDYILDAVTGSDPSITDYVLEVPTVCSVVRRLTQKPSWI
jgi:hypothetical protein